MRYLPLNDADRSAMLETIGVAHVDDLFRDVPEEARLDGPIAKLPPHATELEVERHLSALARKNVPAGGVPCFPGCDGPVSPSTADLPIIRNPRAFARQHVDLFLAGAAAPDHAALKLSRPTASRRRAS